MRKLNIYIGFVLACAFFGACKPVEDRMDISGSVELSALKGNYSITQQTGRDSKVTFAITTTDATVFWDIYNITNGTRAKYATSNDRTFSMVFPFKGKYRTIVSGYFKDGMVIDSSDFTTTANDAGYFSDPNWKNLTNMSDGKYWKVNAKYVGPETNYLSNWWQPGISSEAWANDSIYFDLNQGYHFKRIRSGVVAENLIFKYDSINQNTANFKGYTKIITFTADHSVMPNDDASELGSMYNTFKVVKLTNDTLIVGQGASFIPARSSEDWSWYWIYTRSNM